MSRHNKVNPAHYKLAGRLSPDDLARERQRQNPPQADLRGERDRPLPPWMANADTAAAIARTRTPPDAGVEANASAPPERKVRRTTLPKTRVRTRTAAARVAKKSAATKRAKTKGVATKRAKTKGAAKRAMKSAAGRRTGRAKSATTRRRPGNRRT